MTARRRPKAVTTSPFPPLSLRLTCQQRTTQTGSAIVEVSTGTYLLFRRSVVFQYDLTDGTPIVVESALYSWVKWLMEEERQRRRGPGPEWSIVRNPHPHWPSSSDLGALAALDGPDGTVEPA